MYNYVMIIEFFQQSTSLCHESELAGPDLLISESARPSLDQCPQFIQRLSFTSLQFSYSEHYGPEFVQGCGLSSSRTQIDTCHHVQDSDHGSSSSSHFVAHFGACNDTDLEFRYRWAAKSFFFRAVIISTAEKGPQLL